jgi:hypothetical protein
MSGIGSSSLTRFLSGSFLASGFTLVSCLGVFADESALSAGVSTAPGSASALSVPDAAVPGAAIRESAVPAALSAAGPAPSHGIPIVGWMFYPSMFAGVAFNDNVYQTQAATVSAWGVRLTPNLEADLDEGIHKATIYGLLDAQLYPRQNAALGQDASTVQARAGFSYLWSPTADLVTNLSVNYTRMSGPFGSTLITTSPINSATSFVGAVSALNVSGFRQFANQTTGTVSVQKTVTDALFVRVGGSVQDLVYERPPIGYTGGLSGVDGSGFLRLGTPVTPQVNAFVEGGGDFRRYYSTSFYDTNAFRVIGGLSSDLIGLFRGEVYGGVQRQFSVRGTFAPLTAPAAGGRLTYYPTEYFTIAASSDLSFGAAGGFGAASAISAQNETLQTRLQADYALYQYWRASVRAGYAQSWYYGSSATASTWLAGTGMSYFFWTNWALTGDYQYSRVLANAIGSSSYVDNLVSIGVTYRY